MPKQQGLTTEGKR